MSSFGPQLSCTKVLFASVLILAILLPAAAQQPAKADTVSKIVALEKAWNQAFKLRDTRAIDAFLDDGAVLVNDDGSLMSKAMFLSIVRASKPSDEEQVSPESISVYVVGGAAVATGVFRAKGIEGGKPYVRLNRFADTWINKGGNWVCVSASATPVK